MKHFLRLATASAIVALTGLAGCSSSGSGGLAGILASGPAPTVASSDAVAPTTANAAGTAGATASATPTSFSTGQTPAAPLIAEVAPAADPTVAVAPSAPVDPLARPVHVGWTLARAKKCGFYFDPAKVRANYLNFEAQKGRTPEEVQKLETVVRFTEGSVTKNLAENAEYCEGNVLAEIREDLPKMVAGDFSGAPRVPKAAPDPQSGGLFAGLASKKTEDTFDRKKVFTPPADK